MKQIMAIMITVTLLLSLCGCSQQENSSSAENSVPERAYHEPTGATMEVDFSHAWKAEEIAVPEGLSPETFYSTETAVIISGYNEEGQYSGAVYDVVSGEVKLLESHGRPIGAYEIEEGYQILWNNYHYDETTDSEVNEGTLLTYDRNFKEIDSEDQSDLFEEFTYPSFWYQMDDGRQLICDSGRLYLHSADEVQQIKGNLSNISSVFEGEGGQLYALAFLGNACIGEIDLEEMSVTMIEPEGIPENPWDYYPAEGYDFYVTDYKSGLYGLKGGTAELLIDWVNSDVDNIGDIVALPDGSFLKIENQYGATRMTSTLLHLTERTQEEIDNMKILSLASLYQNNELTYVLRKFNRQSDNCRIVLRDYEEELDNAENTWDNVVNKFFNELISGTIPDILCLDSLDYFALSNKGLFEDWYSYMENDPEFYREDYLMNFFETLSYQGRHERFGFQTNVMTTAAKSQYLPDGVITIQELAEVVNNMPEGMTIGGGIDTPGNILNMLLDYEEYIDFTEHTCRFNSPEFIQLLEIANQQPKTEQSADYKAWINDKALLKYGALDGSNLLDFEYYFFKDTEYSFVGMPNSSGTGNGGRFYTSGLLTMSADSLYKDEIWEFFKFCLREEIQENAGYMMPVRLEALSKYFEPYTDAEYLSGGSWGDNYGTRSLPPATPEMLERVTEYIQGITRFEFNHQQIRSIVSEESEMYFSGDQTAEKCAEMIQNRVSLYLSEQN